MIAPAAAESALSTAAAVLPAAVPPRKASAATTVRDALAVADAVLGVAKKASSLVEASAAAGADRAKSSEAGYAKSSSGASKKASSKSASTKKTTSSKTRTSTKKPASSKSSTGSGALSFLADPKLSIEEKLMRLLAHLNEKWEKDLQGKMDELAGGQGAAKTPASGAKKAPSSKKKGLLGNIGKIADAAKKFFPQVGIALDALQSPAVRAVVGKIGGPVLAAAASALGFPALAPVLLKLGPGVIDVAAGVASAFVDQATATGGGSSSGSGSSGSGGADGAMSDRQMQVKLMEMQRIMDQQKEMFSLVSNILRSGHETRMAVIQNVR